METADYEREDKEIFDLPILDPEAPAKLGFPKEMCLNLMDNYFTK